MQYTVIINCKILIDTGNCHGSNITCHINADCVQLVDGNGYTCKCRHGFNGDGFTCEHKSKGLSNSILMWFVTFGNYNFQVKSNY